MPAPRPHPLLPLLAGALALAACDFDIPPAHTYVVSRVSIPTTPAEAQAAGLDLDGDGSVDNRLGAALAALSSQGVELQSVVSTVIDRGIVILLLNFRAASFSSTGDARAELRLGDNATAAPQPCAGPGDTVCRHHLDGTGTFLIAPASPADAALTGTITGGTFLGGPGEVSFQISLDGVAITPLHLLGARAKATGIGAAGIDSILVAGGLPMERFDADVVPAIRDRIAAIVNATCVNRTPPICGCPFGGSPGRALLTVFDNAPTDCTVSADEIKNNILIRTFLAPDVTIDGKSCLSVGLKVQAAAAAF